MCIRDSSETAEEFSLPEITELIRHYSSKNHYQSSEALFADDGEYREFVQRHERDSVSTDAALLPGGKAYVGIDAGSTTVKAVAINEKEEIIFSRYMPNSGNPVPLVRDFLTDLYEKFPQIQILSSASTGYGEEIIKNAFSLDLGVVETIAHFTAAVSYTHLDVYKRQSRQSAEIQTDTVFCHGISRLSENRRKDRKTAALPENRPK